MKDSSSCKGDMVERSESNMATPASLEQEIALDAGARALSPVARRGSPRASWPARLQVPQATGYTNSTV
jgi:hypothetical protein